MAASAPTFAPNFPNSSTPLPLAASIPLPVTVDIITPTALIAAPT